jgi:ADP-heptose:LPS heptosyltransferase
VSNAQSLPRRTLLVVHPGALGDVILALPAIRVLREILSPDETLCLTSFSVGCFLAQAGEVDQAIPFEGNAGAILFNTKEEVPFIGSGWSHAFRWDACWMRDPDGTIAATFSRNGIQEFWIGSPHESRWTARHQTDRFLEIVQLQPQGVESALSLLPLEGEAGRLEIFPQGWDGKSPLVLCHPGAGSPSKCAQASLWGELIHSLEARGVTCMILQGPADGVAVAAVLAVLSHPVPIVQEQNLMSLSWIIKTADLFIGHDSGLTHLAAWVDTPVIALFGPTDPQRWAPRRSQVRVLHGHPCRCESLEERRGCLARPCLDVPLARILAAAEETLTPTRTLPIHVEGSNSACQT